jgi:hypothetical protein
MTEERLVPPKIILFQETARGIATKFAYLVRIEGQSWAFDSVEDIDKGPQEANALLLDPSRIIESSGAAGQPVYAYQRDSLPK